MKVMASIAKRLGSWKAGMLAAGLVPAVLSSCAEFDAPPPAPTAGMPWNGPQMATGERAGAAESAPSAGAALTRKSRPSYSTPQPPRPGLGTGWGESVDSPMSYTSYVRASTKPYQGVATIWYNDKKGIDAMTGRSYTTGSGRERAAGGLVEWGVKSGFGYLKNYQWDGKRFVAGRQDSRYTISIKSHARSRLELVLSVDGLDVLDGKSASTKKRGYILWPGQTLEVKGWRTSESQVAAFKFASVSGSYSNLKHGTTRNVGVIGMAVFTEKGIDPWNGYSSDAGPVASPFAEAPMHRAN